VPVHHSTRAWLPDSAPCHPRRAHAERSYDSIALHSSTAATLNRSSVDAGAGCAWAQCNWLISPVGRLRA
jgi:hypothetical protein